MRSLFALWLWLEVRAAGNRRRQRARRATAAAGAVIPLRPRCSCTRCAADRAFDRIA